MNRIENLSTFFLFFEKLLIRSFLVTKSHAGYIICNQVNGSLIILEGLEFVELFVTTGEVVTPVIFIL